MTRFFALHFALSVLLLIVTELYFYKNRLKRINLTTGVKWLLVGMICFVAIIFPAESGSRANPEVTPLPILSDWYFLALYQMLKYMDPYWATIWTLGVPFVTIGIMFLDWGAERNPWKRPIPTSICIMAIIQFIAFSLLIIANSANLDRDPPYWYASMVLFITIGQFWHWSLYRQWFPMAVWIGFNVVSATFYLWFWHVQADPWLAIWFNTQVLHKASFVIPAAIKETMTPEGLSWTNLYWNFVWAGFAYLQAVVGGLVMLTTGKNPIPMGGTLPEAKA